MSTNDPTPNNPPFPAELVREPQVRPQPKKTPFWKRLLISILVIGLIGTLLLAVMLVGGAALMGSLQQLTSNDTSGRIQEKFYSHDRSAKDKVAIISVEGAIMDPDGFIKQQIDRALKDDAVKAVVLRVNSPGGSISASDYFYYRLAQLREKKKIPIVVSMGGLAASGGYYVSMAVGNQKDSIFAEPTTWTGSIGVVIPHYNLAELINNWGVTDDSIVSHRLKTMGSFTKPMTEEERKILQALVDDAFTRFKEIVKSGRPKFRKSPELLTKLATGQVFTADQAKESGLVDQLGFLDDAVDQAIKFAKLDDPKKVQVIKYKREQGLASLLLGAEGKSHANGELAAVFDLATPRAYYLCTWLPALMQSK